MIVLLELHSRADGNLQLIEFSWIPDYAGMRNTFILTIPFLCLGRG